VCSSNPKVSVGFVIGATFSLCREIDRGEYDEEGRTWREGRAAGLAVGSLFGRPAWFRSRIARCRCALPCYLASCFCEGFSGCRSGIFLGIDCSLLCFFLGFSCDSLAFRIGIGPAYVPVQVYLAIRFHSRVLRDSSPSVVPISCWYVGGTYFII